MLEALYAAAAGDGGASVALVTGSKAVRSEHSLVMRTELLLFWPETV